jgi:hypothetical protein
VLRCALACLDQALSILSLWSVVRGWVVLGVVAALLANQSPLVAEVPWHQGGELHPAASARLSVLVPLH